MKKIIKFTNKNGVFVSIIKWTNEAINLETFEALCGGQIEIRNKDFNTLEKIASGITKEDIRKSDLRTFANN